MKFVRGKYLSEKELVFVRGETHSGCRELWGETFGY